MVLTQVSRTPCKDPTEEGHHEQDPTGRFSRSQVRQSSEGTQRHRTVLEGMSRAAINNGRFSSTGFGYFEKVLTCTPQGETVTLQFRPSQLLQNLVTGKTKSPPSNSTAAKKTATKRTDGSQEGHEQVSPQLRQ